MIEIFLGALLLVSVTLLFAARAIRKELSAIAWQQNQQHAQLLVQSDRINDNLHMYLTGIEDAVKEVGFAVQDVETNTRQSKDSGDYE